MGCVGLGRAEASFRLVDHEMALIKRVNELHIHLLLDILCLLVLATSPASLDKINVD